MTDCILYKSTNLVAPVVPFRQALLKGLAPDGGLYFPTRLPAFDIEELESLSSCSYPDLAFIVMNKFLDKEIDREELLRICHEVYTFDVPVEKVYGNNYIMRLDKGPTASFKDFAVLFMGRIMQYYLSLENRQLTILTATSGDTGSAVANAFHGLKNIKAIILFPSAEVTEMQRKQMTTVNGNIQIIAVEGKFDDCQHLVKRAFMDSSLSGLNLSSANSINIGRLLPQSVYYIWAWSKLSGKTDEPIVFSVPCGNFGNVTGGLIARDMGLPVKRFVISTNNNNEVPLYFESGRYKKISPSINCISSAMNVGHPSNLARIIAMYGGRMNEKGEILEEPDLAGIREELYAVSINETETRSAIARCHASYGTILEPHGAVAWEGLMKYRDQYPGSANEDLKCVSLETAHPAKFREEINEVLHILPPLPDSLKRIEDKKEEYISLDNNYDLLKDFLIKSF